SCIFRPRPLRRPDLSVSPRPGLAPRGHRLGDAPPLLVSLLEPGDHREGLHAAPAPVLGCCLTLYAYTARPSRARLAVFFAVYALAFGNHLSMILLLVPFTVFLFQVTADRWTLVAPGTIAMALAIAVAGASQYWPNLMSTAHLLNGPTTWSDRLATFWFDATKADWRESMVLGVRSNQFADRLGMWWFDARQQFGIIGLLLAAIGVVRLWMISRPWVTLVVLAYAINT